MLALYVYTPLTLAEALVADGKADEAREFYEAAESLAPNPSFANWIGYSEAAASGDQRALLNPKLPISAALRSALIQGYRALASGDAGAKARAVQSLMALPAEEQDERVAHLLGGLGANHQALEVAARWAEAEFPGPAILWYRDMRGALSDPAFPALATRLGLMNYWKQSRTMPDVCKEPGAPRFCTMLEGPSRRPTTAT